MQKSSKRAIRAVTDFSESDATAIRREARLLSNQLQISRAAALELAKVMAAKRREKLRKEGLRGVVKILDSHPRKSRSKH